MNLFFLAISITIGQLSFAQQKIFNNKINRAGKVIIKSGQIFITNADTVYIEKRSEMVHLQTMVKKDTNEIYITQFIFVPKDRASTFPFDIAIKFDKEIIRRYCISTVDPFPTGVGPMNVSCGDNWVHCTGNFTSHGVSFTVRSKQPLNAEIYGAIMNK